jgi:hypothetical protein
MPHEQLNRSRLVIKSLRQRPNKQMIERDHVDPDQKPRVMRPAAEQAMDGIAARVRMARKANRPVMLAFGAHTIKNGLGPVLIRLMEEGWVTHLATNGAGIIHDWEFSFQGASSEDVKGNVARGEFGVWQETGFLINLAIIIGAYEGLGYGESVGKMIERQGLDIPAADVVKGETANGQTWDRVAAAADLMGVIEAFALKPGWMAVSHPFKQYSAQAAAFRLGIPFTGHPMIGHDIIYNHPMNHGAAIGRTALRDFLAFSDSVSRIQDGVYLSVGSAVMSPMIFEKALSMSQNLAIQEGRRIDRHFMAVVDLAESNWDWQKDGEPPMDNPAYYLRYCKTFSRMGGEMKYLCADNRDFLLGLYGRLKRARG